MSIAIACFAFYIILRLLTRVQEWFDSRDPMLVEIQARLQKIHPQAQQIRLFRGSKSYTLNKQKVYLCLYDENRQYYPMNMLMYVAIHELAHCVCKEIGHTPLFFEIFRNLLIEAEKLGVYDPDIPPVDNYCMASPEEDDEDAD